MTEGQAQFLAGKLAAAFSRDWAFTGESTNLVYVEALAKLARYEAARDAVDSLIESEVRLPPIAMIRDSYRRFFDRYSPPALEEAPLSDEDRAANLERLRELSGRFGVQDLER